MSPRTLRRSRTASAALAAGLAVLTACGGGGSGSAPGRTTKHSCTIMVARKVTGEFKGSASGDDRAKAEEAAWVDACARLPAADRAGCKDPAKFSPATSTGSGTANGVTSYSVQVTLTPVVTVVEGKAEAGTSKEEACQAALGQACAAAGEPGDCLAGGKFEKKGEISGSQTAIE